jgi:hypothetical protein
MRAADALKLKQGDVVLWRDPDGETCNKTFTIDHIENHIAQPNDSIDEDGMIIIDGFNGDGEQVYLECCAGELELFSERG